MNRELILSYFEEYMEAGTYFLHLTEICHYLKSNPQIGGLMLESFALALSEFLSFYQYQILNLEEAVHERRMKENEMFGEGPQSVRNRSITLLELKIHLEPLITQIQLIAYIVIKPYTAIQDLEKKMLERQEREINGEDGIEITDPITKSRRTKYWSKIAQLLPSHQGNMMLINNLIPVFAKEEWLHEFPKGSSLLSYLYNILVALESDLSVIDTIVRTLFQRTMTPYLNFITSFIYEGDFEDPFGEFYIEKVDHEQGETQDINDQYKISEKQKFKIRGENTASIPIFLSKYTVQIFKCGSMLSLLKEAQGVDYFSI
jgi:hypothetical protein